MSRAQTGAFPCDLDSSKVAISSNPDISGIGVLIGFVGTGLITLILLVAYYLLVHDPIIDPFGAHHTVIYQARTNFRPNSLDKLVLGPLRKRCHMKHLGSSLRRCILSMADIQIVTGIGILVSGYASLNQGIQLYHWQLIIYLAWFSALTHLAAIAFVRHDLRGWKSNQCLRLALMFVLATMLIIALVPTTKESLPSMYTICLFDLGSIYGSPDNLLSAFISSLGIMISLVTRSIRTFRSTDDVAISIRKSLSQRYRRALDGLYTRILDQEKKGNRFTESFARILLYQPALALFLVARATMEIYTSMLWEIIWILYATAWGLANLVANRYTVFRTVDEAGHIDLHSSIDPDTNVWSFGQIIAIFLLVAPLLTLSELLWPADDNKLSTQLSSSSVNDTIDEDSMSSQTDQTVIPVALVDRDVYQLPWFRGLIALLLFQSLLICATLLSAVFLFHTRALVTRSKMVITMIGMAVISSFLFTSFSMMLHQLESPRMRSIPDHWLYSTCFVVTFGIGSASLGNSVSNLPILFPICYGWILLYGLGGFVFAFTLDGF